MIVISINICKCHNGFCMQFAGNVLCHGSVSPCDGDWYGGITKHNAEGFLDALVNVQVGPQPI